MVTGSGGAPRGGYQCRHTTRTRRGTARDDNFSMQVASKTPVDHPFCATTSNIAGFSVEPSDLGR